MVRTSLARMARGGIYDQLAGGFARYAVDEAWAVPHFEKMLYDNAQLVRLYAEAAVALSDGELARVARETAAYMIAELQQPEGGFSSSQDADSEGEEGKYFVFRRDELDDILGEALGAEAAAHYGVEPEGNFEHGATVLSIARTAAELARERGDDEAAVASRLAEARAKLLAARRKRVPPATDDKVIAAWNGLAISGLAAAGRLLGEPSMIEAARRAASFVLSALRKDGRLLRVWRAGQAQQPAFADDHAQLAEGLLQLFEATGEERWLEEARALFAALSSRFWDEATATVHLGASDGERLLHRQASLHDNAVPSAGSSAAIAGLRLLALAGDDAAGALADRYLRSKREAMLANPFAFGHLLGAAFLAVKGLTVVAVLGPDGGPRAALLSAARRGLHPEHVAFAAEAGTGPALAGKGPVGGAPAAFVCRGFACEAPRIEPEALARALGTG